MKALGMVRKVDDLGRYVLPKELRDTMGISIGDSLEIFLAEDYIILKKYAPGCIYCGEALGVMFFEDKPICKTCADKFINQFKK